MNTCKQCGKSIDIHTIVASQVFGVPEDKVTPGQRRLGKTLTFPFLYGTYENQPPEVLKFITKDGVLCVNCCKDDAVKEAEDNRED